MIVDIIFFPPGILHVVEAFLQGVLWLWRDFSWESSGRVSGLHRETDFEAASSEGAQGCYGPPPLSVYGILACGSLYPPGVRVY